MSGPCFAGSFSRVLEWVLKEGTNDSEDASTRGSHGAHSEQAILPRTSRQVRIGAYVCARGEWLISSDYRRHVSRSGKLPEYSTQRLWLRKKAIRRAAMQGLFGSHASAIFTTERATWPTEGSRCLAGCWLWLRLHGQVCLWHTNEAWPGTARCYVGKRVYPKTGF
ncbi:hypothetical protein LZ32DRAFT_605813 [Colletotrichum eremochloae]|nr:hypothetical protein LZ32DRAFT_605813 [Colletotrichum eremochloae]